VSKQSADDSATDARSRSCYAGPSGRKNVSNGGASGGARRKRAATGAA